MELEQVGPMLTVVQTLAPGAVVTLPKGWPGCWDITEALRKVYVVVGWP